MVDTQCGDDISAVVKSKVNDVRWACLHNLLHIRYWDSHQSDAFDRTGELAVTLHRLRVQENWNDDSA